MEKGSLIGRGRTAEVFAWGEGRALKLYYQGWPAAAAEAEYQKAEAVYRAGAAAPMVDGVVQVDGRHGVIYEWVECPNFWESRIVERNSGSSYFENTQISCASWWHTRCPRRLAEPRKKTTLEFSAQFTSFHSLRSVYKHPGDFAIPARWLVVRGGAYILCFAARVWAHLGTD